MQNDQLISEALRQDHVRLSNRLAARPMQSLVLARLEHRSRFRGLVLAGAAGLGAVIAAMALLASIPSGPLGFRPADLSFALGCMVIIGTIVALGPMLAD